MNRTLILDLLDGQRIYESTANFDPGHPDDPSCPPGGLVHLRLTSWSGGVVVTELTGSVPAIDAAARGS